MTIGIGAGETDGTCDGGVGADSEEPEEEGMLKCIPIHGRERDGGDPLLPMVAKWSRERDGGVVETKSGRCLRSSTGCGADADDMVEGKGWMVYLVLVYKVYAVVDAVDDGLSGIDDVWGRGD